MVDLSGSWIRAVESVEVEYDCESFEAGLILRATEKRLGLVDFFEMN